MPPVGFEPIISAGVTIYVLVLSSCNFKPTCTYLEAVEFVKENILILCQHPFLFGE
jgi:putative component of membrane protein insertase Oxa1/YidC/SpoIIIJ protein YidD